MSRIGRRAGSRLRTGATAGPAFARFLLFLAFEAMSFARLLFARLALTALRTFAWAHFRHSVLLTTARFGFHRQRDVLLGIFDRRKLLHSFGITGQFEHEFVIVEDEDASVFAATIDFLPFQIDLFAILFCDAGIDRAIGLDASRATI